MRIISGILKGRRLPVLKGNSTRPTTDFAREALFNVIEHKKEIDQSTFLDLFAGTGAVSFEFISRGALNGICVDMSQKTQVYRKQCIQQFEIENLASLRKDVFKFIPKCHQKFDIIFADPPYQLKEISALPELIFSFKLLNKNGLLIVEHPKEIDFSQEKHFIETRSYSTVHFSFFNNLEA
ncbi:MAG: 16S rRNA (guanine(966)-N(2))-methyltransferase RsmD [Bacteroidota bacterium]